VAVSQKVEEEHYSQAKFTSPEADFNLLLSDISDVEDDVTDRFITPVSDQDIEDVVKKDVPSSTRKSILWAVNLFEMWRKQRNGRILRKGSAAGCDRLISSELGLLSNPDLSFALCRFIVEARKVDGSVYPPKTIRQLILLIQMYLQGEGRVVRFLMDSDFISVQNTLDNIMKRRAEEGLGLNVRRAEVISHQKEDVLWTSGLLGDSSPTVLLDTIVYLIGLHFALRSGDEHRTLSPGQLQIHSNDAGRYLQYTEKISKNNRRGLKEYHVERKVVRAYEDLTNTERCIVRIYEKYVSLCPDLIPDGPFYLQPLKKPQQDRWFSTVAVGRNTLYKTVTRICSAAGFKGTVYSFYYGLLYV
jgi:hypothetical protein